jgi:S1-C subfamily serine protease
LLPGEFSAFGVPEDTGGVLLTDVPPGSRAALAGLRAGDLIRAVDDIPVKAPVDFGRKLMRRPADQSASLRIRREQAELRADLPPPFDFPEKERESRR